MKSDTMVGRHTELELLPTVTWVDNPFHDTSSVSHWVVFLGHRTLLSPSHDPSSRNGQSGVGYLGVSQKGSHILTPSPHSQSQVRPLIMPITDEKVVHKVFGLYFYVLNVFFFF